MEIPKSTIEKSIYFTMDDLKSRYRIINGATIYKWIKERDFPKQIKIGGKALWSRNEIELYDEKQMAKR
jgi:predicted DNA-binding transcriptional regulator AlpA